MGANDRYLPARRTTSVPVGKGLTPLATWRKTRAVQKHLEHAAYMFEIELIDLEASTQITLAQLEAEMAIYVWGMERAGGDEALQLMVARKLAHFCESNNLRLIWRYR